MKASPRKTNAVTLVCLFALISAAGSSASSISKSANDQGPTYVCPYRAGGIAIALDGDINEWRQWPGSINFVSEEQVVYGKNQWKGTKDLSGTVWTAWDEKFFYLAAEVKDDVLVQREKGPNIWKGDHLEIFIDTAYKKGQATGPFGKGQFQIGLSPGNFLRTKDPFVNCPCEAVILFPNDIANSAIQAASQRTADGYTLEAAIPWDLLGLSPRTGACIGLDICLSDTDQPHEGQKAMMSMLTTPWRCQDRGRLVEAILGDAEGKLASATAPAAAATKSLQLFDEKRVAKGNDAHVALDVPELPAGTDAILSFLGRIEWKGLAGGAHTLLVQLNDVNLEPNRLVNRKEFFNMPNLKDSNPGPIYGPNGYFLFYSPNYEPIPAGNMFYVSEWADNPYALEFDVTSLLKKGNNALVFKTPTALTNIVGKCSIVFRETKKPTTPERQALAFIQPVKDNKVKYSIAISPNGGFKIILGKTTYEIESQFSQPDTTLCKLSVSNDPEGWEGKVGRRDWKVSAVGKYYRLERTIAKLDECVQVSDTLTSTSTNNIGIIVRHLTSMPDANKVHINGFPIPSLTATASETQNPTTFFAGDKGGIGFMPEDDVFRVHSENFFFNDSKTGGIMDNQFVLRPGTSYTFKWSVYPSPKTDYYDFVNAVRRKTGVNFTIQGGWSFIHDLCRVTKNPESQELMRKVLRFAENSGVQHFCYGGGFSLFLKKDHPTNVTEPGKLFDAMRKADPALKTFAYFHCFILDEKDAPAKYADARSCGSNGKPNQYPASGCGRQFPLPVLIPTLENSFGADVTKDIDLILDEGGADGVYWDEMEWSGAKYHYGKPWDGCTGIINPSTYQLEDCRSSTILLSQPWRVKMMDRILKRGKLLVANSQAQTETMTAYHFPRFIEVQAGASGLASHLYTPIAYGCRGFYQSLPNKVEERSVACYREMLKMLDAANVYYWNSYIEDYLEPSHKMLCAYMFPFTPVELHKGYVIGKERIITAVSGRFGWGDKSQHEVHVFNDQGVEVEWETKTIEKNRAVFTEIALPEFYSAAILKR